MVATNCPPCEKCNGVADVLCVACDLLACIDCITRIHAEIEGGTNHSTLPCPRTSESLLQPECGSHLLPLSWFSPTDLATGCVQCQAGVGITLIPLKDLQEQLGVAGSLDKVLGQARAVVGKVKKRKGDLSSKEDLEHFEERLSRISAAQEAVVRSSRGAERTLLVVDLARLIEPLEEELGIRVQRLLDEVCSLATSVASSLASPEPLVSGDLVQLHGVLGPHSFFITRPQDEGLLVKVSRSLELIWEEDCENPLTVGGCAILREDDMYFRVRLEEVEEDGEKARVTFLDKVGQDVVALKSLVGLGKSGPGSWTPVVQPASLANLPREHVWGNQVAEAMEHFARGPCVLVVLERKESLMMVELVRPVNKRVPGDLEISLSTYLASDGYLPTEDGIPEVLHCPPYIRRPAFSLNVELEVLVSQVDSGDLIWVQDAENTQQGEIVETLLEKEYSSNWLNVDLEILVPFSGLRCVTRSGEGGLSRAIVTGVESCNGLIEIRLVDTGARELKPLNELKKTLEVALVIPLLATPVSLADLAPRLGQWQDQEVKGLRQLLVQKRFSMFVERRSEGEKLARVVLYERGKQEDVSLNSLVVELGLALSSTCALPSVNFAKPCLPNFNLSSPSPLLETCGASSSCQLAPGGPVSPHHLQVQSIEQVACARQLGAALHAFYADKDFEPTGEIGWKEGDGCVAKINSTWVRSRVEGVEGEEVLLYLPDNGTWHRVEQTVLQRLEARFQGPPLSTTIHLPNVLPLDTKAWSVDTCRQLEKFLAGKEFEVKSLGVAVSVGKGKTSLPAKVMVARESGLPTSLSDLLMVWGVARVGTFTPKALEEDEECRVQDEVGQSSNTPPKNTEIFEWLPPQLPTTRNFEAVCRHVDWEGRLYVTLTSNVYTADVLRLISLVLDAKYKGSRPRPTDKYWRPGDLCIAQWSEDRRWYRGEVLAVDLEGSNLLAHVYFVDYGTDQWCEASQELRKELFMKEQPVQALPLVLKGVSPRGNAWTEAELDLLHKILVDKVLEVEVDHLDILPLEAKVICEGSLVEDILQNGVIN